MLIDKKDNTTIITQEKASIVELIKKIDVLYDRFKNDNIIVNVTGLSRIPFEEIIDFLQMSNRHRSSKHSFVIVATEVYLDKVIDELIIVPTLQEAFDIIEMEDIERDLGF